jgi:hypothetical protein
MSMGRFTRLRADAPRRLLRGASLKHKLSTEAPGTLQGTLYFEVTPVSNSLAAFRTSSSFE